MRYTACHKAVRRLSGKLAHLRGSRPLVPALPRGGVAVGFEIAQALNAPLDIVLVRKVEVPWQPELALDLILKTSISLAFATACLTAAATMLAAAHQASC